MSVKVVVAVGNRKIERCIARMEAIDVLTTVRKREAVLNAVINYNPHAVILSRELSGKTEMTAVIQRCRNLKEQCRIVFIYGEVDAEYKYFSDFLVRQGIYNILTGAVDEDRLEDAIERTYTAEDVVGYQAGPEEDREPIPKPIPEVRPVAAPEQEKELEILLVEKIVERETIQTKVLGNVVIGVAALYPHGGSRGTGALRCHDHAVDHRRGGKRTRTIMDRDQLRLRRHCRQTRRHRLLAGRAARHDRRHFVQRQLLRQLLYPRNILFPRDHHDGRHAPGAFKRAQRMPQHRHTGKLDPLFGLPHTLGAARRHDESGHRLVHLSSSRSRRLRLQKQRRHRHPRIIAAANHLSAVDHDRIRNGGVFGVFLIPPTQLFQPAAPCDVDTQHLLQHIQA